jgi:hypothetical protein
LKNPILRRLIQQIKPLKMLFYNQSNNRANIRGKKAASQLSSLAKFIPTALRMALKQSPSIPFKPKTQTSKTRTKKER